MADNRVRILATLDDKVSSGLDKIHDRFDTLGKSKGFQSVLQGVGVGAGISIYSQLGSAVGKVTDLIGESIQAALADEESQNRLRASLTANVPAWDGNTTSIEKNILAKQRLGFQDETLRDSLTVLVGATHDVAKAQEIQNTAMDLARFKGIDLQTASEALIKVEGGVYRSLKQLGIKLKDNATSTEALAAVQAVASGQAEAYAQTNAGKLLASQIQVGEALENFGRTIMPAAITVLQAAADKATEFADQITGITEGITNLASHLPIVGDAAKQQSTDFLKLGGDILAAINPFELSPKLNAISDAMDAVGVNTEASRQMWRDWGFDVATAASIGQTRMTGFDANFGKVTDDVIAKTETFGTAMTGFAGNAGKAADDIERGAHGMATTFVEASRRAAAALGTFRDAAVEDAKTLVDKVFDPILRKDAEMATQAEIAAQRAIIASKKSSASEIADARARLHELEKDNANYLIEMAKAGQTNNKTYTDGVRELKKEIAAAHGPAKAALQGILDQLREIEKAGRLIKINFKISSNIATAGNRERAVGGPVTKGQVYTVGEKGPETFVPDQNGTIIPNGGTLGGLGGISGGGGGTGGGGASLTVNFNSVWPPTPAQARAMANAIDAELYKTLQRAAPTLART